MSNEWHHGILDCYDEGFSCQCCLEITLMPRTYGQIVEKQLPPGMSLIDGCCHPICCSGQFFIPCLQSFVNDIIGAMFPPLAFIGALIHLRTRTHLKQKYGIGHLDPGFDCGDFCAVMFCKCCTAYQELREMRERDPGFKNVGQPPAPAHQTARR